jgi:ribosome-associated translation inhibitor RaiA
MQVPMEIGFHNLPHEEWAEDEIRARAARLEKMFDQIVSCRVRVEQEAVSSTGAALPRVHIEVRVPGRAEIIVAHSPPALKANYQNPDLRGAISESFDIAERQLVALKEQIKGRSKIADHDIENQFLGQVAEMHPDEDYGFLLTKEGGMLYFHRNSMLGGSFDELTRGTPVHYVETVGDTGPIATKVRVKEAS